MMLHIAHNFSFGLIVLSPNLSESAFQKVSAAFLYSPALLFSDEEILCKISSSPQTGHFIPGSGLRTAMGRLFEAASAV